MQLRCEKKHSKDFHTRFIFLFSSFLYFYILYSRSNFKCLYLKMRINHSLQKISGIFTYQRFLSFFELTEIEDFYSFLLLSAGLIADICRNLSCFHFCHSLMNKPLTWVLKYLLTLFKSTTFVLIPENWFFVSAFLENVYKTCNILKTSG